MTDSPIDQFTLPCSAFAEGRKIAAGSLVEVALAVKSMAGTARAMPLIVDDRTGRVIDVDIRGSTQDVIARLAEHPFVTPAGPAPKRGRPKLGVVAREITLLPRHWDWLAAQSGSASQVLRRLIDQARASDSNQPDARLAQERAYRFISAFAGDLPGFEDASRALFANDADAMRRAAAPWPEDLRDYALKLAQAEPLREPAKERLR